MSPFNKIASYAGIILSGILYGLYLVIFTLSCRFLRRNTKITPTQRAFYISYSIIVLFLNTIYFACWSLYNQFLFLHPTIGDTSPYSVSWYLAMGYSAQTAANTASDILLIYRYYLIFGRSRKALVLPTVCLLGFSVLSYLDIGMVQRGGSKEAIIPINTTSLALTVALNAIITFSICARLLSANKKSYIGLVAIFAESAALLTILGIFSLITTCTDSPLDTAVSPMWAMCGGICPQFIILRLALGTAWKNAGSEASGTHLPSFAPRPEVAEAYVDAHKSPVLNGDNAVNLSPWHPVSKLEEHVSNS